MSLVNASLSSMFNDVMMPLHCWTLFFIIIPFLLFPHISPFLSCTLCRLLTAVMIIALAVLVHSCVHADTHMTCSVGILAFGVTVPNWSIATGILTVIWGSVTVILALWKPELFEKKEKYNPEFG